MTDERTIHSVVFETSPYGTVDAIVEHDDRAIYFYLNENPASRSRSGRFGMRACWVRNLELGPHVINVDEMQSGIATMLPRHDCVDPHLHRLPDATSLKVIWFEEGTGAALLEIDPDTKAENVIAVIPPWSGVDGFHGYAANCANPTDVCWPMPDNPLLIKRIENSRQFWDAWRVTDNATVDGDVKLTGDTLNPWETRLPEISQCHGQRFGRDLGGSVSSVSSAGSVSSGDSEAQWEVPGDHFPLLKVLHFKAKRHDVLVTAGMSIYPQPAVEMFVEDPRAMRRIEIALLLSPSDVDSKSTPPMDVVNQLMGLALYPWHNFTWLGPGHTCNLRFGDGQFGLLLNDEQGSRIAGTNPMDVSSYREDPVNLLWLVPINQATYDGLVSGESTVDDFVNYHT